MGSVHYPGGIFSVVFGIISVPAFCWSPKRALLSFCRLEQARKCVVSGAFGRRNSGLIRLSHVRSKRGPVLEVGFSQTGGSAWASVAEGKARTLSDQRGRDEISRSRVIPGMAVGAGHHNALREFRPVPRTRFLFTGERRQLDILVAGIFSETPYVGIKGF